MALHDSKQTTGYRPQRIAEADGVILRDARTDDLAAINGIYNHYVQICTCTYQEQPESMEARRAWFDSHGPGHPIIVVEAADGGVVAWGALSIYRPREAYRFTVEDSVYVRHDMHGRGFGQAILAELVSRARVLGYHSIVASISADRHASIALHEKLGFAKVAHFRELAVKFGRWLDLVFLQRMLDQPQQKGPNEDAAA